MKIHDLLLPKQKPMAKANVCSWWSLCLEEEGNHGTTVNSIDLVVPGQVLQGASLAEQEVASCVGLASFAYAHP